jgi:hypothetical protein
MTKLEDCGDIDAGAVQTPVEWTWENWTPMQPDDDHSEYIESLSRETFDHPDVPVEEE